MFCFSRVRSACFHASRSTRSGTAASRIGVPGLKPHLMCHVAATIWLAASPGDYATFAAFLCDSVNTVEKFYARGEGADAAKLFAEALEALDPTLKSFMKRS